MINYVIGRYWNWKSGSVASYMEYNNVVFRGTEKEAFEHAQRISKQEKETYRVFRLLDIGSYYDPDPC